MTPVSPTGSGAPSSSRIRTSTPGHGVPTLPGSLEPLGHRDPCGAAFARAVQLGDLARRQRFDDAPLHRDRARRTRVDEDPQRREVERGALGLGHLEDADEVRGHHEAAGDPVPVDESEPLTRVEGREHHGGRAGVERGHRPATGTGVVRGPGEDVHVVGRPAPQRELALHHAPRGAGIDRGAVHDTLGTTRGSRRVEDRRRERRQLDAARWRSRTRTSDS